MDHEQMERARQTRDPRFDGKFFIGVKTTGIYCRPVCPVRLPRAENVTFYPSAAAASEAGFRPCLRCRPEAAPGTPAWAGTSTTVKRALRLINDGALDEDSVEALAGRVGVTTRHLHRLFIQHLGAAPKTVALTRRLQFARKLVAETSLSMTDIAMAAGYGSVRRFNDHFRRVYDRTPASFRGASPVEHGIRMRLAYRPPFSFTQMLTFLGIRATPGVEVVTANSYQRHIRTPGETGVVTVTDDPEQRSLLCDICVTESRSLLGIVSRVRRVFDLDADPLEIATVLGEDPALAELVSSRPGLRVPGAWDPFEVAVRAIAGQQVSVKGATTVMGRIAAAADAAPGFFPAPGELALVDPARLPMPMTRARAITSLARVVSEGELDLLTDDVPALVDQLMSIHGIGPWTAQYVAMRVGNDPDAFLASDLVLLKVAKARLAIDDARSLEERSNAWRPFRAYAGMYLWSAANELENSA